MCREEEKKTRKSSVKRYPFSTVIIIHNKNNDMALPGPSLEFSIVQQQCTSCLQATSFDSDNMNDIGKKGMKYLRGKSMNTLDI